MICGQCAKGKHKVCKLRNKHRDYTSCDCQHRQHRHKRKMSKP